MQNISAISVVMLLSMLLYTPVFVVLVIGGKKIHQVQENYRIKKEVQGTINEFANFKLCPLN